jgi:hypothetical protein
LLPIPFDLRPRQGLTLACLGSPHFCQSGLRRQFLLGLDGWRLLAYIAQPIGPIPRHAGE